MDFFNLLLKETKKKSVIYFTQPARWLFIHLVKLVTITSDVCVLPVPEENCLFLVGKCSNMLPN